MKFILDIDGVMVHANPHRQVEMETDGFYKFSSIAVKALNAVINANGEDELVLSSSHRFKYTITQWRAIFKSRGILTNHISIIDLPIQNRKTRKYEIETWVNSNSLNVDDFVIIDDDKSLNELPADWKQRLVLTSPYVGLNTSNDLKKILRKKVKGGTTKKGKGLSL